MILQLLLYTILTIPSILFFIFIFKIVLPEKRIYDALCAQGVKAEPYIPFIGQLREIRQRRKNDKLVSFQESLAAKHGNVCCFCFGPIARLLVTEPDLIADILSRSNSKNYIKPPVFNAVFSPIIGEKNLLVAEGDEHERARRMISPAFYHENLKSMVSIIVDQTKYAIDDLFSMLALNENSQGQIDVQAYFNELTLAIIASSALGSGYKTITNAKDILRRTFGEVLNAVVYRSLILVNQIPFLSRLPFFKRNIVDHGSRVIGELVDQIIVDRRQGKSSSLSNGPDLLDLLLSAVDDQNQPFIDQEIKEQTLTFVLAGSDTTSNLMTWIFYMLTTHDHVLKACQEEIDKILPRGTQLTYDHLTDLVVCEAVINETLRLYPPASSFVRYCVREHTIGTKQKLRIPVGTNVIINNQILHRRNDLWPRANEFDYTRWIRDQETGLKPKLPHKYAYLPFAAGNRNCIGQNFALLEAKIILAMFIQRCRFELVPGQTIVPDYKITMKSKYGLWIKFSER